MAFGSHINHCSQLLATVISITITKKIGYYDCLRLGKAVLSDEEDGIWFTRKRDIGLAKTKTHTDHNFMYIKYKRISGYVLCTSQKI